MQKLLPQSGRSFPALNYSKFQRIFLSFATLMLFSFNTLFAQTIDLDAIYASDGTSDDQFGQAIDVYGDYIVVGVPSKSTNYYQVGAAYIYKRNADGAWEEIQKLEAPISESYLNFGISVSIYEDKLAIGAMGASIDGVDSAGAVYMYTRNSDGIWGNELIINAPVLQANHGFGWSIDLHKNKLVVSAPADNQIESYSGAIFCYEYDGTNNWSFEQKIKSSDIAEFGLFGYYVEMNDENLVATSYEDWTFYSTRIFDLDDSGQWVNEQIITDYAQGLHFGFGNAISLDDDELIIGSDLYSAIKIFEKKADGSWEYYTIIEGPNGFGSSVYISDQILLIGTPESDISGVASGAVYMYLKDDFNSWDFEDVIIQENPSEGDLFGSVLNANGGQIVIAALGESSNGENAGAVYTIEQALPTNTHIVSMDYSELHQNSPNPFFGETSISFDLEEAGEAVISIKDTDGKLLRQIKGEFAKGQNTVTIEDLEKSGVLYYTLEAANYISTKKMINLN